MAAHEKVSWVGIVGSFLVLEGIASMLWSQDKQPLSQMGRVVRVASGVGLLTIKICG